MFLTALLKKDTLHTNRMLEEINRIYMKHPYTWQLLCMIINLDTKYRDYNDRLRVLERQFFNGANHLMLYAEAYVCFQERVSLLRKLESFEVQILNFATKYQIITRDLAIHMADLVCRQKKYDVKLLRILERAYKMYDEPLILKAICTQLILGNKTDSTYFKWYEAAVKQELRIAQLYEFFMMSVDAKQIRSAFPKIVYLYYSHGIQLDYRRVSILYENILIHEKEDGEIYKQYKEQMKEFAAEHLQKRHINDSLRVIYNRFINPNALSLDEMDAIYDICHAYQVTTKVKGIKYVLVIEKVNIFQVAKVIGKYKNGQYKELPQLVRHFSADRLKITCEKPASVNLDGEMRVAKEVEICLAEEKIRFFYPKGLSWKAISQKEIVKV